MNKLVRKYQCPGCAAGPNKDCYKKAKYSEACVNHTIGTFFTKVGMNITHVLRGLPNGFCRTGGNQRPINLFRKWEDCLWLSDSTIYNIPVWHHINKAGHTLIRVYQPRKNLGFTLVFGGDVSRKLPASCVLITQEMIDEMD